MDKVALSPTGLMYPRPALLVGANVDGKANYMVVGGGGVVNGAPPMIGVLIQHHRHTLKGIRQNLTFSVNIPSVDLARETDYCGLVSGDKVDKAKVCKFKTFYGELKTAPLIEQCPVNHECKVVHILNLGSHSFVIGQVEGTHVTGSCLTDSKPDVNKIKPLIFDSVSDKYSAFGEVVAPAHRIGQELKERE
ncbi:flavin reductase family protein [Chloroflexota bacterium]